MAVGNSDAYGGVFRCGGDEEERVINVLNEYMMGFQNRNPHLFVFSCHCHRDEQGVPHIHIDYIPWTDLEGRGLPVRVSENGAFKQQGLTSGERGDSGTIAFQYREREELTKIARRHDINIIEGKRSKKHLSKEEYVLQQEQERSEADRQLIEKQAGELLQYQDELIDYLQTNGVEEAFSEHIENISLRGEVANYEKQQEANKQHLASCWDDYNSFTASFFAAYRENKKQLWEELRRARETSRLNQRKVEELLYDITHRSDFFIVKIVKLLMAFAFFLGNQRYENEIEQLQEANRTLKEQARKVLKISEDISVDLRTGELMNIEQALSNYEMTLQRGIELVNNTTRAVLQKAKADSR